MAGHPTLREERPLPASIFISSTCYDLLDLRSELDQHLSGQGLRVLRSDGLDFEVEPDKNSIETCLCRVREADHFVCILSQRYGPSLKKAGYDDVSATELECRVAREAQKHVHFFVRDRLSADFAIWKKSGQSEDFRPAYANEKDATRLFAFIEAHSALGKDSESTNWMSDFRTVVDLKEALDVRFDAPIRRARIDRLVESGRIPLFDVRLVGTAVDGETKATKVTVEIKNVGGAAAIGARLGVYDWGVPWQELGSICEGDTVQGQIVHQRKLTPQPGGKPTVTAVQFSIPTGELLEVVFFTQFMDGRISRFIPRGMNLVRGHGFQFFEGGSTGYIE